jgi:hypothetical protein
MRRPSPFVLGIVCFALWGCEEKPAGTGTPSASAAPAASSASAPAPQPAVAPPAALDVEGLKKSLKCSGKASEGPCPILEEFGDCKEGWTPITQSGDGRWVGTGYVVKDSKFTDEITLMRSKRVGVSEVAPGQLGAKVSLVSMPENSPEESAVEIAIRALARGDVPKAENRGVAYVLERSEWPDAFVQQADKHQVYVAVGAGAYLCSDKETQRLFVVRLASTQQHPADGLYATLHAVKW